MKIKVGIAGAAGYTGGELLRILLRHPQVELVFANSKSNSGKYIAEVHDDLLGETDMEFSQGAILPAGNPGGIDVLFLCVGHGEAKKFLEENKIDDRIRIIDLSNDFRLSANANFQGRHFIYGLPELNRELIRSAASVANPGCFATAIQLGLLPLAKEGLLTEVYTTGITGSTGAGQGFNQTSHFSWRANNIQAYKTLTHQHLGEINQSLKQLQEEPAVKIHFVPWRGDFTRGIFTSSTIDSDLDLKQLLDLYKNFYNDHPFVSVSDRPISLKQVVNTNKALIQLEKTEDKLVVHSVIDNLLKGASGQAVENMNLMFGVDEREGLMLKAAGF